MLERRIFEGIYNQKNEIVELVSVKFLNSLLNEDYENNELDSLWRQICRDGMTAPIIIPANIKNNKLRILDGKKRIKLFRNEGIMVAPAYLIIDNKFDDDDGVEHSLCLPGILDSTSKNFEIKTKPSEVITSLN